MAKSTENLRRELAQMKHRIERLRAEGRDLSIIEYLERWVADAEVVLAQWDDAREGKG